MEDRTADFAVAAASTAPRVATVDEPKRLEGQMGVASVVLTVLAFSAPVVTVSGFMPFLIVFGGTGGPAIYIVATGLLLLFSVGFTTMTRFLPNPGAFYAYITAGLGRTPGLGAAFLAMNAYFLLGCSVVPFMGISTNALVHDTLGGPAIAWYWWSFVGVAACGVFAYRHIELSAKVLSIAMVLEVIILTIFDLAVTGQGGSSGLTASPFGWTAFTSGTVGVALLFAMTNFFGFEATAIFREEVRDPDRTIPRATYICVASIGLFYMISVWALIMAFGTHDVARIAAEDPAGMFNIAMTSFVARWVTDVVTVLVVTSAFASLLSCQNVLARYLYSLGTDGALPRTLGRVHHHHHSPAVAAVVVTLMWTGFVALFAVLGSDPALLYARASGTGGFALLLLLLLTSVAVVAYFRARPGSARAGVSTWHTAVAPIAAAAGLSVVVYLAIAKFEILVGAEGMLATVLLLWTFGVFLLGAVLAALLRRSRPQIYRRIGRHDLR
jgi:amino acid transporter